MRLSYAVFAVLGFMAALTACNIAAIYVGATPFALLLNVVGLYTCGALLIADGLYLLSIPERLNEPLGSKRLAIAVEQILRSGGLVVLVGLGRRMFMLGILTLAVGIYLRVHISS